MKLTTRTKVFSLVNQIALIAKVKMLLFVSGQFFYKLVEPKKKGEDDRRREFVLNVLLVCFLLWFTVSSVIAFFDAFDNLGQSRTHVLFLSAVCLVFYFWLYRLSRGGRIVTATYLFLGVYFLPITYALYQWGANLPQGLLMYALFIVMSGVLLSSRVVFVMAALLSGVVLGLSYLQSSGFIKPNLLWEKIPEINDAILIGVTFFIISFVSWLSNRETEKSLFRARNAERDLRAERDLLEVKVKERTEELEKIQFEKTKQMQNFVEFGRHASGLFHDMVNPVQAAILSLYTLKQNVVKNDPVSLVKSVDEVATQMERAREFINLARNQITRQDINIEFDPEEQIAHVFQMLSFRAKRENVELKYSLLPDQINLVGNPLSFHRLVSGLVSNAIDAYDGVLSESEHLRTVSVTSKKYTDSVHFSIADNGKGISKKNQDKVFELFFTTKGIEKGTGVGLALSREIVEKEFSGTISFKSEEGVGSVFTIILPIRD